MRSATVCLWAVFTTAIFGQNTNQGTIIGTVTDPAGGTVAGARISAANTATGFARETRAAIDGAYRLEALPPGEYELTSESPGFKRYMTVGIMLQVGQLRRVDVHMEVGQVSEAITVTAVATPVNSDSPGLGEVIANQEVTNLPLNGREFLSLAALLPGAESGNPKIGAIASKGITVGFNGARSQYNAYYIDGADSTDANFNQLISSPSLDAIREFRVDTNMYSAQYGRSGGAVISVVTKSGTNSLHGSLFEFHRNQPLDALPYFYRGARADAPKYLFNQFGATAGGKIIRNKTFYFGSYEGFRQKKPGANIVIFAPTARERVGDLSQTINPYTNRPAVVRNPFDGTILPQAVVPQSLISPIGRKIMGIWQEPNFSGDPFLNLRFIRSGTSDQTKYLARIDHTFSAKNSLSGTFNFGNYNSITPGMNVYGDTNTPEHDRTFVVTYTRIVSPRTVNDLKASHTWYTAGSEQALRDKNYADEWGIYNDPKSNGSPFLRLYTVGNQFYYIGQALKNTRVNKNFFAKDLLVTTQGKHTLSLGGDFKFQKFDWSYLPNGVGGNYYMGLNDGGAVNITGSTFASVLMAVPAQINVNHGDGTPSLLRRISIGAFVQDEWKLSPRLTLSLGLRYDYESPMWEANDHLATFNYATGKVVYAKGAPEDVLSKLRFPFERGGPNRAYDPNYRNFAPRLGFAWRPFGDNKTAVRGGYGLFFTSEIAYSTAYASWIAPFAGQFTYTGRAATLREPADHFVTMDQKPYKLDDLRYLTPGTFFSTYPYYPQGYLQQWNFAIARQLPWNVAFEMAYVGSKGTNLGGVASLLIADQNASRIASSGSGIQPSIRLKGFNSKYNSLQLKGVRRSSKGLSLIGAFTWGRSMAESSTDQVVENLFSDVDAVGNFYERRYARADFDVRFRGSLSIGYELPYGKGRSFGSGAPAVANAILGNWSIRSIVTLSEGYPFSVYTTSARFPDRICDGNIPSSQRTLQRWYDTNCFVTRQPQTVVRPDGSRVSAFLSGNSSPNVITGPGTNNIDLALHKEFPIGDVRRFQFRFESFNIANHPNFIGPPGGAVGLSQGAVGAFLNTATGGQITRARDQRSIQLALKFLF